MEDESCRRGVAHPVSKSLRQKNSHIIALITADRQLSLDFKIQYSQLMELIMSKINEFQERKSKCLLISASNVLIWLAH